MKQPSSIPRLCLHDCRRNQWLLFSSPVNVYSTCDPSEVSTLLEEIDKQISKKHLWAAGWISYEASAGLDRCMKVNFSKSNFPLVWIGLFESPEKNNISFSQVSQHPVPDIEWQASVGVDEYKRAVRSIRNYISRGDTYQVNYTYRLHAGCAWDPLTVWDALLRRQPGGYAAYIETREWAVCSASPELFFEQTGNTLLSRPMKGTGPRGKTLQQDKKAADALHHCQKNRAENIMIVDMVRNDMGHIAKPGTVKVSRLFDVEQYPTLLQMTSTVECQTNASFSEKIKALFPAASITGAPKIRTMEIIQELEQTPRDIYTGTLGFLSPDNIGQWNIAIRTAWIDKNKNAAFYGTGGGIVWDSEEKNEFEESILKTQILCPSSPPPFDLLETMLWTTADGYFLLDEHLNRMQSSAEYFGRPVKIDEVRAKLEHAAQGYPSAQQLVRLCVGPQGETHIETRQLHPLPCPYTVCLADVPVSSENVYLYHKTTYRDMYEKAQRKHRNVQDVLLWNEAGLLTEFCIANVIVQLDHRWYTPPISNGLLPGVYREYLLKTGAIEEKELSKEHVQHATKIAAINSVRKIIPVELKN